jgi:hypothetical protein
MTIDRGWPYRHVLREACDLWTAASEIRDAWLEVIAVATAQIEGAIRRERALGVAPSAPGWQASPPRAGRLSFRTPWRLQSDLPHR